MHGFDPDAKEEIVESFDDIDRREHGASRCRAGPGLDFPVVAS